MLGASPPPGSNRPSGKPILGDGQEPRPQPNEEDPNNCMPAGILAAVSRTSGSSQPRHAGLSWAGRPDRHADDTG